jgi:hypothetical protein
MGMPVLDNDKHMGLWIALIFLLATAGWIIEAMLQ